MVVLTHGLTVRPLSTALRASSAAPSMTDGLEVLVQEVIAAITTAPWSSSKSPYSLVDTLVGFDGRPAAPLAALCRAATTSALASSSACTALTEPGSLAGNDSSMLSSSFVSG